MKLSKFAKTVKQTGICDALIDENGNMWLSNGNAVYKTSELPEITTHKQMTALLDIDKDKAESIAFKHGGIGDLPISDWDATEHMVRAISTVAILDGNAYACVKESDGNLWFYNDELLQPLSDVAKSEYFTLAVREAADGKTYIAAKDGLQLVGLITRAQALTEEYIDSLHEFLCDCQAQLERENAAKQPEETE